MVKLENEMKSDTTDEKRDNMTGIFPEQLPTKGMNVFRMQNKCFQTKPVYRRDVGNLG